jgi:hypothetical protein
MRFLKVGLASLMLASLALIQGSTAVANHGGYHLFGDAMLVSGGNPGMAAQLRSIGTGPQTATFGGVDFDTPTTLTIAQLNVLATDYKFTSNTCGGGSPRFQINVGGANIFVYIGPAPNYTGCATNTWESTGDLLTATSRVDTSQLPGGSQNDTWGEAQARYGSLLVTGIQLVADGGWFFGGLGGTQTVLVDNVNVNGTIYTFDAVVVDPRDKEDCKNGGWEDFTSSPGPFKNQGDCVSYFATGGKNKASD